MPPVHFSETVHFKCPLSEQLDRYGEDWTREHDARDHTLEIYLRVAAELTDLLDYTTQEQYLRVAAELPHPCWITPQQLLAATLCPTGGVIGPPQSPGGPSKVPLRRTGEILPPMQGFEGMTTSEMPLKMERTGRVSWRADTGDGGQGVTLCS